MDKHKNSTVETQARNTQKIENTTIKQWQSPPQVFTDPNIEDIGRKVSARNMRNVESSKLQCYSDV